MAVGVGLGKAIPDIIALLRKLEFGEGSQINIPIAIPLRFELDGELKVKSYRFLGDPPRLSPYPAPGLLVGPVGMLFVEGLTAPEKTKQRLPCHVPLRHPIPGLEVEEGDQAGRHRIVPAADR